MSILEDAAEQEVLTEQSAEGLTVEQPTCPADFSVGENRSSERPALDVVVTAAWFAFAVGWAEGLYWLVQKQCFGSLIFMHPGFLWMSPLAQLAWFAVPGAILALVARLCPRSDVLLLSVTLLALLGWWNLLLLAPGIHPWARLLASCGLAVCTGRLFQNNRNRCTTFARRSVVWLTVASLIAAFFQTHLGGRREADFAAALPAAEPDAPHVLLIVLDTVRADALSVYGGDPSIAPNLNALAERGVVFEQAWSTAPWTLPSQAGMFTGRAPHELSGDWMTPLDNAHPTLAEELSNRGWLAGGFVGNTRYCSEETGLARGFCRYEDYPASAANMALCTALGRRTLLASWPVCLGFRDWPGRKPAPEVSEPFLRWVAQREDRPFFAFLNYWDAHDPYVAPPEFRSREPEDLGEAIFLRNWWWVHKEEVPKEQVAALRTDYEDCIRALDDHVGRLLETLQRRGELDDTILIVTSDHGEHFGDHGLFLHGNSLYEPLLHVPLIVVCPGKVPAGVRVKTPVSLSGLPNTIMELTGEVGEFPGESWARHWKETSSSASPPAVIAAEIASQAGSPPCHGRSPVAHGPMRCVRQGDLKVVCGGDSSIEAYDLAQDSREQNDLSESPAHAAAVRRLIDRSADVSPVP